MKNLYFTEDNPDFEQLFYEILPKFGIIVNRDYQFVYDEFLKHLIDDTKRFTKENFNPKKITDKKEYMLKEFKKFFMIHFNISGDTLRLPEKYPEFKRKVRTDKLDKINEKSNGFMV